ncbi:MAG: exosortase system-associated protein, TIGR04073 family [Candidatus Omnitrophica bacterium]|nr:exosortase system-associated protein, TIGR04073 family [Candidatus Omnitrophota bacterium]
MTRILRILFFLFALMMLVGGHRQQCQAEEQKETESANIDSRNIQYDKTPLNKLGRGVVNTLTCLLEVPGEAIKVGQEKDPLTGATLGIVEGFCTAGLRGLTGIFDTITFFIPPYDKPKMLPEYALQSFLEKSKEIPKPSVPIVDAKDQGN